MSSIRYRVTLFAGALQLAMCVATQPLLADPDKIQIGSKSFTESVILGEVLTHLARSTGVKVEHRAELGGTQILWQALQAGDIGLHAIGQAACLHRQFASGLRRSVLLRPRGLQINIACHVTEELLDPAALTE